ncbi:hybrid sensor histidine kinase/response regulator [Haliangium ochraceum]|uniref:hybrid sensor histidine kinase/response regulator n=1 Tax=Haliangium ochraceum TaxID=80816 RepID=UPI00019B9A10|nr:ATP-binding protein [Haliangium ochraceum]
MARALEHVADIVEISDGECCIQYVNRAFERVTGFSRDEVVGESFSSLIADDAHDAQFIRDVVATVLAGERWTGRMVYRTKDDEPITLEVIISPIRDEGGAVSGFVTVKRDMAEREALQNQLMESERLSTVGQLVAGIAHEINNPLSLILADADFLREQVEKLGAAVPAPVRKDLQASISEIQQGVDHIRGVVRDLGAFARSEDEVAGPADVREVLDSTLSLLGNEIKHRARLVRRYGDVPPTWAKRSRLGQVFLNLILNAVQAIPVGAAQNHQIRLVTRVTRSGQILVEVSDTGAGIPAEVLPRLFDPFFATSKLGQDVGLRISVSHSIVTSMGGDISVHSIPGHGTTFVVSLPVSSHQEPRPETQEPTSPSDQRGRRLLVIDDEPAVLRVIKRMLKDYDVTTSQGGQEALDYLLQGDFDLILCDLMMPEYTGMDLYQRTADDRPEIIDRFMFVTGGAFTKQTESFLRSVSKEALGKPFTTAQLRDAVNKRLSAR